MVDHLPITSNSTTGLIAALTQQHPVGAIGNRLIPISPLQLRESLHMLFRQFGFHNPDIDPHRNYAICLQEEASPSNLTKIRKKRVIEVVWMVDTAQPSHTLIGWTIYSDKYQPRHYDQMKIQQFGELVSAFAQQQMPVAGSPWLGPGEQWDEHDLPYLATMPVSRLYDFSACANLQSLQALQQGLLTLGNYLFISKQQRQIQTGPPLYLSRAGAPLEKTATIVCGQGRAGKTCLLATWAQQAAHAGYHVVCIDTGGGLSSAVKSNLPGLVYDYDYSADTSVGDYPYWLAGMLPLTLLQSERIEQLVLTLLPNQPDNVNQQSASLSEQRRRLSGMLHILLLTAQYCPDEFSDRLPDFTDVYRMTIDETYLCQLLSAAIAGQEQQANPTAPLRTTARYWLQALASLISSELFSEGRRSSLVAYHSLTQPLEQVLSAFLPNGQTTTNSCGFGFDELLNTQLSINICLHIPLAHASSAKTVLDVVMLRLSQTLADRRGRNPAELWPILLLIDEWQPELDCLKLLESCRLSNIACVLSAVSLGKFNQEQKELTETLSLVETQIFLGRQSVGTQSLIVELAGKRPRQTVITEHQQPHQRHTRLGWQEQADYFTAQELELVIQAESTALVRHAHHQVQYFFVKFDKLGCGWTINPESNG